MAESQTLKRGEEVTSPPANKDDPAIGRKFDGRVFSFNDNDKILEIVRVFTKANESTSFFSGLQSGDFTFANKQIRLVSSAAAIKVDFVREVSRAEFAQTAPPELVAEFTRLENALTPQFKGQAEAIKSQNIALNGAPFNNLGEVVNGMKGLFGGAKPIKDAVQKVRPTLMQQGAGDGSADKISAQVTNIRKLTKKTTLPTVNLNKVVISQGSPNVVSKVFTKHLTASPTKIIELAEKTKSKTLTPKVTNQLKTALNKLVIEKKTPATSVVEETGKEIKVKMANINNPAIKLNVKGLVPAGGRSGANVYANAFAKVKQVGASTLGDIKSKISSIAPGVKIPDGIKTPPNIIEGFDSKTGLGSFKTNISKLIKKGNLTSDDIQLPRIVDLKQDASGWRGFFTGGAYDFKFVDTFQELRQEIENSDRANEKNENAIRALVIGWTAKLWGPPEKVDAKRIHEFSKKADLKFLVEEESATETDSQKISERANLRIQRAEKLFGIQSHYVVLTDGRVQRGRPIDEVRNPSYATYDRCGLQLTIVATPEHPPTPQQQATVKKFVETFYSVLDGANVLGDDEISDKYTGPGIDVANLREQFNKTINIDDPKKAVTCPTRKSSAFKKPLDVVKPTTSAFHAGRKFSFDALLKDFESIDEKTGEVSVDIEKELDNINKAMEDINDNEFDIAANIEKAKNESFGAANKGFSDLKIQNLTVNQDALKADVDAGISALSTNSSTAADGLTKRIEAFSRGGVEAVKREFP